MGSMKLRHQMVLGCGVLQLIFGLSMFICGILLVVWKSLAASFGVGFWGGIWAILTGALGTAGGMMRKKGLETAFMVLSILAAVILCLPIIIISYATSLFENGCPFVTGFGTPSIGDMLGRAQNLANNLGVAGASVNAALQQAGAATGGTNTMLSGSVNCPDYNNMYGAEKALMAFGILLLFVAIISASLACCAVCRCCGAIDDTIRPMGGPKTTVVTSNGYQFQQAGQPVSYVNGRPIGQAGPTPPQFGQNPPQYGQTPPQYGQNPPQFGQNPPQNGQFGQQPIAQQQPNVDPFNQSQQNYNYNAQPAHMQDFPMM